MWEMVQQQNSTKDIPIWQAALPDAQEIRLPIQYFRDFFDANLLDTIVGQSILYCTKKIQMMSSNWTAMNRSSLLAL